jgi:small subunit ribosomal protein S5
MNTMMQASGGLGQRHTFAEGGAGAHYQHELLDLARVTRVVKGGRRFRFRASVVIGDRRGKIGFGIGKSKDVQQAIQKAQKDAEKNMIDVPLKAGTIAFAVEASLKGAHVLLKPAREGTGLIAGGTVRTVADLCGIKDLVAKAVGTSNKINNARASMKALSLLRSGGRVRGKKDNK